MIKRSVVIKRKNISFPEVDYKSVILFALFLCGIIIGSVTVLKSDGEFQNIIKSFTENFIKSKNELNFIKLFSGNVFVYMIFPMFAFLFGLCAVGLPLIYSIPFIYGLFYSIIVTFFISMYGTTGLGFSAIIIIPAVSVTAGVLMKCCSVSSAMSVDILSALTGNDVKKSNNNGLIKEYVLKYVIYFLISIISSLIMSGSFKLFGSLFNII